MKIDLHLHTKRIAQGDPKTREITPERFKKELKDADVGIAAITNHYIFDEKQYNEMCDENYILLPGVELDIKIKNKRVQANVIVHRDDIKEFQCLLKEIQNKSNPISSEDFIKKFNKKKWIINLDYKNSQQTAWKTEDMRKIMKEMNNALVLVDTNRANTLMILNANNFNAFIGTDIQNWDNYQKESQKLIHTQLNIENYDVFWSILKNTKNNIEDLNLFKNIQEKPFDKIEMKDSTPNGKENYYIKNLIIKSGVNVIFGTKRTGKTKILEYLNNEIGKNCSYYISSSKDNEIQKLQKEMFKNNFFDKEKNIFQENVKSILDYKEDKFNNFNHFYLHLIQKNNKIYFHNTLDVIQIQHLNVSNNKQIKKIKKLAINIKETKKIIKELNIESGNWEKENKVILDQIWILYKNICKKKWIKDINANIKKSIDLIIEKNKGTKPKPTNIGLFKRFQNKKWLMNNLDKLEENKKLYEENIKSFKIPGRKNVCAFQMLFFVDFHKLKNVNEFKKNKKIVKIKNVNKKIKNLKKERFLFNFNLIVDAFKEYDEDPSKYFIEYVKIKDKNDNNVFSNGEKAHLLLSEKLNELVEYFLLDEPGVFLSKDSINDFLLPKIAELSKSKKTIVIVTHNSSLGINTIPINYIYRKYENENDECKTYLGTIWKDEFINLNDNNDKLNFKNEIINSFEGSIEHFEFRKDIYENKI